MSLQTSPKLVPTNLTTCPLKPSPQHVPTNLTTTCPHKPHQNLSQQTSTLTTTCPHKPHHNMSAQTSPQHVCTNLTTIFPNKVTCLVKPCMFVLLLIPGMAVVGGVAFLAVCLLIAMCAKQRSYRQPPTQYAPIADTSLDNVDEGGFQSYNYPNTKI